MYSKTAQTKPRKRQRKTCVQCNRNRLIKFFEKPTSHKCKECLRKNKRLRRAKSTQKRRLMDKLDSIWSERVKERAKHKCEYCGKTDYLNSHHIFSRSNLAVRWDLENGVCLCSGHHVLKSDFSAHKTCLEFVDWIIETRGKDWEQSLRDRANKIVKYSEKDLQEMIDSLR